MASIKIDDKWWSDPRRINLGRYLNNQELADGFMVNLWRLAFGYYQENRNGIPKHVFDCIPGNPEIVKASLVYDKGEFVFVRGCFDHFDKFVQNKEKKQKAGKKSAEKRLKTFGTSQPKRGKYRTELEHTSNTPRTQSNTTEHNSSLSLSKSHNNALPIACDYTPEFEEIWVLYNRKGNKKKSFEVFNQLRLTEQGQQQLKVALNNYMLSKPEQQYRKDLERYLLTDWREDLTPRMIPKPEHLKTVSERNRETLERYQRQQERFNQDENGNQNTLWPGRDLQQGNQRQPNENLGYDPLWGFGSDPD